jgi:hypothetical protein
MNTRLVGRFEIGNGSQAVVVYRYVPEQEVKLPPEVKPRYFNGAAESDLVNGPVNAVMWGLGPYGSTTFIWSCPGSVDSFSSSSLDLFSINLNPKRSLPPQAAEVLGVFSPIRRKSTAYKVPGAAISTHPWPWHLCKLPAAMVWS